jgi:hypothetical protein
MVSLSDNTALSERKSDSGKARIHSSACKLNEHLDNETKYGDHGHH